MTASYNHLHRTTPPVTPLLLPSSVCSLRQIALATTLFFSWASPPLLHSLFDGDLLKNIMSALAIGNAVSHQQDTTHRSCVASNTEGSHEEDRYDTTSGATPDITLLEQLFLFLLYVAASYCHQCSATVSFPSEMFREQAITRQRTDHPSN